MKKTTCALLLAVAILVPLSGQEGIEPKLYDVPVVCNALLPGYGVGSFMQGDSLGGTLQLVTQLAGLGCFLAAVALAPEGPTEEAIWLETAGLGITVASRFLGVLLPLTYADRYNDRYRIPEAARPKSSLGYVFLNTVFPGFGVGSFVQGDGFGGTIQILGEALPGIALIAGIPYLFGPYGPPDWFNGVAIGCACLYLGARYVWGPLRPIWYAASGKRATSDR